MTEYIASSRCEGSRPSSAMTAASSSSVMPSCWCSGSSIPDEPSDRHTRHNECPRIAHMEGPPMPAKAKKAVMTDAHKAALAEGRNQARLVGNYLEALDAHKPKRGRKRTADSVKKRLDTVNKEVKDAAGRTRLLLIQERRDLEVELAGMQGSGPDLSH